MDRRDRLILRLSMRIRRVIRIITSAAFSCCVPAVLFCLTMRLWGGRVANATEGSPAIVRQLNADLKNDDRVDVSLLPVGDGLYLACKR